jgi:hypothetical protein
MEEEFTRNIVGCKGRKCDNSVAERSKSYRQNDCIETEYHEGSVPLILGMKNIFAKMVPKNFVKPVPSEEESLC